MNGVHDMGGMHGFGPVEREENEPPFHAEWEARVRAMMGLTMARGVFNLDAFRYGIEQMDPAHYLRSTYYERWLESVQYHLIQTGAITEAELNDRIDVFQQHPDTPMPQDDASWQAPPRMTYPAPPDLPARYAPGDPVVVRNVHPPHHTRMPRYTRGKRGVVHLVHSPEMLPDKHAHDLGVEWQTVYNVCFDARELWGESADPNQSLYIDLWESYLEPAES